MAVFLAAAPAAAQPVPEGRASPLSALVAPVHGRKACFARRYDAAHRQRHPRQLVTAMSLTLRYHRHPPDRHHPHGQRNTYFTLTAVLGAGRGRLTASGECMAPGSEIACTQDCDGGGFGLTRAPDGTLLLDLTRYGRLRMTRGCGGEETGGVELMPGADDRIFRLVPSPAGACGA
ncbi:hypothetical protein [Methylobacterium sp. Leaf118]|uniref:hypothetical protein n=1 Tax=Methylobacterium sp. Leaf118 TaxID=2876562 RepID=UPI001E5E0913|nr:hypothetical protein [Methylobacterium sp. Leaf118]